MICSVHEYNDKIIAVILRKSFNPRRNYIPCSFGRRIGYSIYLVESTFSLVEIHNGDIIHIGEAILDFKSESASENYEEPVLLKDIIIRDKNNHGKGYGSILMTDILNYCKEKKMYTIIGNKSFVDTETPEKYEHWHRFYVDRWGFTETDNEIKLIIS